MTSPIRSVRAAIAPSIDQVKPGVALRLEPRVVVVAELDEVEAGALRGDRLLDHLLSG